MWTISKYVDSIDHLNWQLVRSSYSWIADMSGVLQDPIHHAEGDVEIHTRMVVESLLCLPEFKELSDQDKSILFAAALLHDVEKRSTTIIEDGRITAPRHAKKGEYTSRSFLYVDEPAPFAVREHICKLVRHHGLPLWISERNDYAKKIIECSLEVDTKLLYILSKADVLGRICGDKDQILYQVEMFKELCIELDCFGKPAFFENDLSRFTYFNSNDFHTGYVPFDDRKFEVFLMSGLPGSGKDTVIRDKFSHLPVVSLDDIRRRLKIKPTDKSGNGTVVQIAKEEAKEHMRKHRSFVWNATNITRDLRGQLLSLFHSYGANTTIVYVESPYRKLLHQNNNREHVVPENVINRMIQRLEVPSFVEAHSIIRYVK